MMLQLLHLTLHVSHLRKQVNLLLHLSNLRRLIADHVRIHLLVDGELRHAEWHHLGGHRRVGRLHWVLMWHVHWILHVLLMLMLLALDLLELLALPLIHH